MSKLTKLLLQPKPLVMGILNTTPDSFSDGGRFLDRASAEAQVLTMLESGADIIDIGGESTRPGAAEVSVQQELERVLPMIECAKQNGAIVSVDTSKPEVMQEALKYKVDIINDVRSLTTPGALEAVANSNAYTCIMHMQGEPQTMQQNPQYDNVVSEVQDSLIKRIAECEAEGVSQQRIIIDPGFGFGKTLEHNCQLMRQLMSFNKIGCPILVGVSRKTMIGQILDKDIAERGLGSVVAASYAALNGAKILRVHDVEETVQAMKIINAFQ
ncbi:dihydropteroate synthase [Kangiella japonica]|uniref:Dihydropteroate synthase n=1 Tax=Kangiella japonica TaxID=647384 RepID=A0ABN0SYC1_9GAMM